MIEYEVVLHRFPGSGRLDTTVYISEEREQAIEFMHKYDKQNGFSILEKDGRFTIADILLVETERIAGKPPKRIQRYLDIFNIYGDRRNDEAQD